MAQNGRMLIAVPLSRSDRVSEIERKGATSASLAAAAGAAVAGRWCSMEPSTPWQCGAALLKRATSRFPCALVLSVVA